jgi:hypothetical protein
MATALGGVALAALGLTAQSPKTAAKKKKRCQCKAKGLGVPCSTNKECCPNQSDRICALRNGGDESLRCCGVRDAGCDFTTDCCLGFVCEIGVCVIAD